MHFIMFPTYFSGHYVPVDLIMYEWKISVVKSGTLTIYKNIQL